jgi:O-antigen/teichoic acid export membrane protein
LQPLATLVLRNAVVGGIARIITLAVGLALTSYLVSRLGVDRFGVWALVSVVTGVVGLFDLGLKTSFVKFLAEVQARGDAEATRAILSTGFFSYLVFAALVGAALLAAPERLMDALRIPAALRAEAYATFLIGTAGFLVSAVLAVFPAVCDARQRMDLMHALGLVCLVIGAGLTVAAVEAGFGLRGVALAQFASIVLFYALSIAVARWMIGPFGLSPWRVSPAWLRRLFPFGLKLYVSSICDTVNRQLDKLLFSRWLGLSFVSSYELALRLVSNAGSPQQFLAAALLPATSYLRATGEEERLLRMYREGTRWLALVGVPPFAFVALNGSAIMRAWIGRIDTMAVAVVLALTAGYLINTLTNAAAFICQGIGRPEIQAAQSALQLVLNVVLSITLFWTIGPLGAPLGTTLALMVGAAYFARRLHAMLGLSTRAIVSEALLGPLAAAAVASAAAAAATARMSAETRGEAIVEILASGFVLTVVYGVACWWTGLVGARDLARLRGLLNGGGLASPHQTGPGVRPRSR